MLELETPSGRARAHLRAAEKPAAALVLGHGAGGGIGAPDLVAASDAAFALGLSVALVEQPYRVAGRRSPAPAGQLDAAWIAVVAALQERELADLPLFAGGRSSGARVACRTAVATGVAGVICLAFPLQPPARRTGTASPSRRAELDAVPVPLLVVQGEHDRFGMPRGRGQRTVVKVRGDHGLKSDLPAVSRAVRTWLLSRVPAAPPNAPARARSRPRPAR